MVMPEPLVPGDGYHVRISQVGTDQARCSDSFYLMGSDEADMGSGASITVLSPTSESLALPGQEYTVQVRSRPLR